MPEVIMIRGVPGSGKSTFAKILMNLFETVRKYRRSDDPLESFNWSHYENDDYFTSKDGTYKWIPELIPEAARYCQDRVRRDLEAGFNVIVSNTHTKPSDYKWLTDLCDEKGYRLTVLTMEGDHGSVHGIPKDKMEYFRRNMRIPFRR